MNFSHFRVLCLALLFCASDMATIAEEPLTLGQAVEQALEHNPEAAVARADGQEARAASSLARTQLLPKLNFTEDISRGDDPVYAFGTRLRQRQFTQADFALNALNSPQPIGNFATRFSGTWTAFDSLKTQKEIRRADLLKASATSSAKAADQRIVMQVVEAYQSVLYAQREVDVAQHERETAAALLASVEEHVKAGAVDEGDPGQVEKAKTALKSAAIGYALAILAPLLVSILASVVSG